MRIIAILAAVITSFVATLPASAGEPYYGPEQPQGELLDGPAGSGPSIKMGSFYYQQPSQTLMTVYQCRKYYGEKFQAYSEFVGKYCREPGAPQNVGRDLVVLLQYACEQIANDQLFRSKSKSRGKTVSDAARSTAASSSSRSVVSSPGNSAVSSRANSGVSAPGLLEGDQGFSPQGPASMGPAVRRAHPE